MYILSVRSYSQIYHICDAALIECVRAGKVKVKEVIREVQRKGGRGRERGNNLRVIPELCQEVKMCW